MDHFGEVESFVVAMDVVIKVFTFQQDDIDLFRLLFHTSVLLDGVSCKTCTTDFKACDGYLTLTKTNTYTAWKGLEGCYSAAVREIL